MPEYLNKPIENDWTTCTLILDLTNSLGEQYHFKIEPEADAQSIPTRPYNDDTTLLLLIPLLEQIPPLPHSKKNTPKK